MQIETRIKVDYEDMLGDDFGDDEPTEKEVGEAVEEHIREYCREHKLDRTSVKIIRG